jgi:dihydrofolate synthase / folylpolyglutamate synthase
LADLTYDALIAELFPRLTGGIRWGLDRTRRMLAEVGNPHLAMRVLHIGGTNGKGSVAAHAESVLRADGRSVALYTSPHLCTFRERVRLGGAAISEDALLSAARRLWPAIQREQPSFFEATTAIAFLAMAESGAQTAVVEVGLGGRLDSTNVVEPEVVVLTNVSLDHVQLLGPTVADVAREKAGIIKTAAPVITGEASGAAHDLFRAGALAAGAPFRVLGPHALEAVRTGLDGTSFTLRGTPWGTLELHTALPGRHQAVNAALATLALGALRRPPSADAVRAGLQRTRWSGRLQLERIDGVTWVFDVAHNVAGVEALVTALADLPLPAPLTAVVGVLGDKDWANMLSPLCAAAAKVLLTVPPTAPPDRLWEPARVLLEVPCAGAEVVEHFGDALESAQRHARAAGGSVLVTGSFHTVGDALAAFGRCADGSDIDIAPASFGRGG